VLRIWHPPTSPYHTDAFFERAAKLWAEAEALVKDDPALSYNVRMSALPVIYARLERWPATSVALEQRDGVPTPVGIAPEYASLAREFLRRGRTIGAEPGGSTATPPSSLPRRSM
jgi:hypothetical protein